MGERGEPSYPLHELQDLPPAERAARSLELSNERFDREWQARHPEVVELYLSRGEHSAGDPDAERGARLQLEARARHDVYDRLPLITAPTLVCSSRGDGIAPPSNGEAIAAQIPGARFELFDGGHLFFVLDPRAWPTIVEFLRA